MTATILHLRFKRPASPTTSPAHLVFGERDLQKCDPDWLERPRSALPLVIDCCDPDNCAPDWIARVRGPLPLRIDCCVEQEAIPVILGDLPMLTGEALQTGLQLNRRFSPDFYTGEHMQPVLSTFPVVILEPMPALHGEVVDFYLRTEYALEAPLYHGEELFVNPTFPLAINLEAPMFTGEHLAKPELQTSVVFSLDMFTGEHLAKPDLSTFPSAELEAPMFTGERIENHAMQVAAGFAPEFGDGAIMNVDKLDSMPVPELATTFYHGEAMELDTIERYEGINAPAFHGENLDVALATTAALAPKEMADGQVVTFNFTTHPPSLLEARGYTGEHMRTMMNVGRHALGLFLGYTGETVRSEITVREQPSMVAVFYDGASSVADMRTGAGIMPVNMYNGTGMLPLNLESGDLIRSYTGESMAVDLWTEVTMDAPMRDGVEFETALSIRPSEPLGIFNAYTGESVYGAWLKTMEQIRVAATIHYNTIMYCAIQATTYFDLDLSCCTNHNPGQQEYHRIEMNHAEMPDEHFDGDRISMVVDLQTQPRFQPRFQDGAVLTLVDVNPYLAVEPMRDGATLSFNFEAVQDFPLCPGNFVPDGDHVYVELEFEDDTQCESDYAYHGETMQVETIRTEQSAAPQMYDGAWLTMNLTLDDRISVRMYHGETLKQEEPDLNLRGFFHGEHLYSKLYDPPIDMYDGATMSVDIKTLYDVEFLERGCLDNEYQWQDENGDPIPEKFNPVPVEMDPYRHDVKAHCF